MIINNILSGMHQATASTTSLSKTQATFTLVAKPKYFYIHCNSFTFPSSGYTRIAVVARATLTENHLYAVNKNGRIFNTDDGLTASYNESTKKLTIGFSETTYGNFYTSATYKLDYFY